jgi:hypothetical protein
VDEELDGDPACRARARVLVCGRMERPGAHRGSAPTYRLRWSRRRRTGISGGKLLEGNATGRHLFDGAGDLFHRGSEVAIGHLDDRLTGLLYAFEDLLVFDFEFGVVLSFFAYDLAEGVVLARVGRDIPENGHLVDVGLVFWICRAFDK